MTDRVDSTAIPQPAAPSSPSVADGREHRLDPRSVDASRVAGGVAAAVLAFIGLVATLIIVFGGDWSRGARLIWLGAWLVLAGALVVFSLVWPGVRYRYTAYRVDRLGIRIRRGVLWRSEASVPRSRVQHTDVSRGPIDRAFGLATLIIYTAGTEHASVALGGLSEVTAQQIRDHLIEGGPDDAV